MSDRLRQTAKNYDREMGQLDQEIKVHQAEIKRLESRKADVAKAKDAITPLLPKEPPNQPVAPKPAAAPGS